MGKLTALKIKSLTEAGRYTDGDGLALVVNAKGSRSWLLRIQKDSKRHDFTIGSAKNITLAQAREQAVTIKAQVMAGIDPKAKDESSAPLFRDAAQIVYEEQRQSWKSKKHRAQWLTILETYAFPFIGDKTVNEITGPDVRSILIAIWQDKHETARRVRQRTVAILDWAVATGHREHPIEMRVIKADIKNMI